MEHSGVVLLLGAPGAGKSVLGRLLSQFHSPTTYGFVNVGDQLRATGRVQEHLQHPTQLGKKQLAQMARDILEEACRGFKMHMAQSRGDMPSVLLLEFVKELDDAFILMEVLQQYGITLRQVLYVSEAEPSESDIPGTVQLLKACLSSSTRSPSAKFDDIRGRAAYSKDTDQRQNKWQRNAAGLIEFFSALGVLAEVTAAQLPHTQQAPAAAAAAATAWGLVLQEQATASSAGHSTNSRPHPEPPKGTLAALAYAAAGTPSPGQSMWLTQVGWCCSSTGSLRVVAALLPDRLQLGFQVGSCVENVVTAVQIEPVVSQRLITSAAERDQVLQLAASYTGLYNAKELPSSSTRATRSSGSLAAGGISSCLHKVFAVPLQSITSKADARWVGVPGRYMVSHKCDGTRYLLVATGEEGTCYLVNRAGMVYRFPYRPDAPGCTAAAAGDDAVQELQPVSVGSSSSSSDSGRSRQSNAALAGLHPGMQGTSSDIAGPEAQDVSAAAVSSAASTSCNSSRTAAVSPVHNLPAGTVLDGELVWQPGPAAPGADRLGRFLVFDALSIGGSPVWQLPLQDRLRQLQQQLRLQVADTGLLPLSQPAASTSEADTGSTAGSSHDGSSCSSEGASIKPFSVHIEASGTSVHAAFSYMMSDKFTAKVNAVLNKKQQAPPPPADRLMLLFKPHYDVTADAVQQLQEEAQSGRLPFTTDGLVFTPKAMPYGLGMAQLLTKWQPVQQTAADLTGKALQQQHNGRWSNMSYLLASALEAQGLSLSAATTASKQLQQGFAGLPSNLVYECVQLSIDNISMAGAVDKIKASDQSPARLQAPDVVWLPQSVRWDKVTGNHSAVLEQIQQRLKHPGLYCLSHEQLLQSVREVQQWVKHPAAGPAETAADRSLTAAAAAASSTTGSKQQLSSLCASHSSLGLHPARAVPFDELYADIQAAVTAGAVEVSVDDASGLEVFCYNMAHGAPSNLVAAMCRGLVLHPGSKSVVATPFVRFDNLKPDQVGLRTQVSGATPSQGSAAASSSMAGGSNRAARGGRARGRGMARGSGSTLSSTSQGTAYGKGGTAELELAKQVSQDDYNSQQMYQTWGSQLQGTASFKLDGSLIIAFVWQGQLYTCTRRRMDSEQAIWAHTWLQEHVAADALQPGWTYLFEAIYRSNTHVIQYPFEGLVLLGAVDPEGSELPSAAARQQLAQQLGVLAVPSIDGTLPELTYRLAQGSSAAAAPRTDSSRTELTLEEVLVPLKPGSSTRPQPGSGGSSSNTQRLAPAMFEGWVVQDLSSGQRYKMVQGAFKLTGDAASTRLHPLAVWDAVYCERSRAELMQGLPEHNQVELDAILAALEQQFRVVQQRLDTDLQAAWIDAAASSAAATASGDGSVRTPPAAAASAEAQKQQGSSTSRTSSSTAGLPSTLGAGGALPARSTGFNAEPASSSAAVAVAAAPAGAAEDASATEASAAADADAGVTEASTTTDDASNTATHSVSTYPKGSSKQTTHATRVQATLDTKCDAASISIARLHGSLAGGSSSTAVRQLQICQRQTTDTGTAINIADSRHQHHTWHLSAAGSSSSSSSRTGSGCKPDPAAGISAQAYAEALEYALLKGTARVSSMFKQEGSKLAPSLRGLLLSCIKPSPAGILPGYQPSEAFQQTYCKGWAKGPQRGRVSVLSPEPLILTMLTDQALMGVLGLLQQRRDIGNALLVCRAWSRLLQGDAEFQQKAQQAAASMPARRYHAWRTRDGSDARSWYDSDNDFSDDYSYDRYRSYSDHSGYGSC